MSQFSESYHLKDANIDEAVQLVRETSQSGYVGKLSDKWVTLIPESAVCGYNYDRAIVKHNKGVMLQYVFPEDHGFIFRLFQANNLISEYFIDINESDFEDGMDASNLNSEMFVKLTGIDISAAGFEALMQPKTWDEYFALPGDLMGLLGIAPQAYEWLSYHYCELNKEDNKELAEQFVKV